MNNFYNIYFKQLFQWIVIVIQLNFPSETIGQNLSNSRNDLTE